MKCTYCHTNPGTKKTGVWCGFRDADTGDCVCWSCRAKHYRAKAPNAVCRHVQRTTRNDFSTSIKISDMNQLPVASYQLPVSYPKYFRKGGRCIRQDGPTTTWTIGLHPEFKVPVRFPTVYPSQERLQEELNTLEPTDAATFESFATTFYQQVGHEREQYNLNKNR